MKDQKKRRRVSKDFVRSNASQSRGIVEGLEREYGAAMRVLVGCEESGTVRDAFRSRGHDAWSCDLLPSRSPGQHLRCDIFEALQQRWDLIILHPDCTALSLSGNRTYGAGKPKNHDRIASLDWTERLWLRATSVSPLVALEQPMSVLAERLGSPDCIIHPWEFGHPEQKQTWLWLRGLPPLKPTKVVWAEMMRLPKRERERVQYMAPSPERKRDRAKTYTGVADAMAVQWGEVARCYLGEIDSG